MTQSQDPAEDEKADDQPSNLRDGVASEELAEQGVEEVGDEWNHLDSAAQVEVARHRLAELRASSGGKKSKAQVMEARERLVDALLAHQDLAGAVKVQRELLAEMTQPRSDEKVMDGHLKLGLMLGEQGRHAKALEELWDNVDVYKKAGKGIPVNVISALTWSLTEEGHKDNLKKAESILRDVLKQNEMLDKGDLHNLRVLLANALHNQGKVKEEVDLRRKVLECSKAEHGEDSAIAKQNEQQLADAEALNLERRNWSMFVKVAIAALAVGAGIYMQNTTMQSG